MTGSVIENLSSATATSGLPSFFPKHGWALNDEGVKHLWFPIFCVGYNVKSIRKAKNVSHNIPPRLEHNFLPVYETANKLTRALRELASLICSAQSFDFEKPDPAHQKIFNMPPMYIDMSFIYLRIFADQLLYYYRPILFDKPFEGNSNKGFNFNDLKNNPAKFEKYEPICDWELLKSALAEHTSWFEFIRNPQGGHEGFRDAIMHLMSLRYTVGISYLDQKQTYVMVNLYEENKRKLKYVDLVKILKETIDDFSKFCTLLYASLGVDDVLDNPNQLCILGKGENTTYFWPKVG